MDALRSILSDPIWNGIEGLIALILFLIYLLEKRKYWTPPIRFIGMTTILFVAGLLPSALLACIPTLLFSILGYVWLPSDLVFIPQFSLLTSSLQTIAAMTTNDDTLSRRRAFRAGILWAVMGGIYAAFYYPYHRPSTPLNFIGVLLSLLVGGSLMAELAYAGVSKARSILHTNHATL